MFHGLAIDQLHGQRLIVAVAADFKADFAAWRNIAEQTPQNASASATFWPSIGEDDVVDLEPDLAGRRVVIDEGDDCAVNVLELEGLRFVGIDVGDIDAEVAGNTGVGEKWAGVLKERHRELLIVGVGLPFHEKTGNGQSSWAAITVSKSQYAPFMSRTHTGVPRALAHSSNPCKSASQEQIRLNGNAGVGPATKFILG